MRSRFHMLVGQYFAPNQTEISVRLIRLSVGNCSSIFDKDHSCVFLCLVFPHWFFFCKLSQVHSFMSRDFHQCFFPVVQHYRVLLAPFVVRIDGEVWEVFLAAYSDHDEEALAVASARTILCACEDSSVECVFAASHVNF